MKLLDVINQLKTVLPKYFPGRIADSLDVSSLTVSLGVATLTTSTPHNLKAGREVVLSAVKTHTAIENVTKAGNVATITTAVAHDLTPLWPQHETITLAGFDQGEWNTEFEIVSVLSRFSFKVRTTLDVPETLTGNEYLLETRNDGVNGKHLITQITGRTLKFSGITLDGTYSGGIVQAGVRIGGAVTLDHALQQYTEQGLSDLWCFVVMDDLNVSRDRTSFSDAVASKTASDDMRLRLIDGFQIVLVKNVTSDAGAVVAVDLFRHDMLAPILKSVYGVMFETGLSGGTDFRTVITGANFVSYNLATFAYAYKFQVVMDVTNEDAAENEDSMAFRTIEYSEILSDNEEVPDLTVEIELDSGD